MCDHERGGLGRGCHGHEREKWAQGTAEREQHGGGSEAERMMILRMVEEKKITAEEAERLLEALG
jgi:hypothetical protein